MVSPLQKTIIETLRRDFQQEVAIFLTKAGLDAAPQFRVDRQAKHAAPVYILTGASFTLYDQAKHGNELTHAFWETPLAGHRYLMNNTAAILQNLVKDGCRVLLHTRSDPDLTRQLVNNPDVRVIQGDLGDPEILQSMYRELAGMAAERPISDVAMALYQSFAQNSGEPFKPMHKEAVEEVERAASRRLRFIYNMAAMGYDLLMNRGQDNLRIVSLSALAANRASYGLLADAADKFMNELAWRTFYLESNISTGKPVSVFQINPGITTACDTYRDPQAMKTVLQESIADGFPLSDDILRGTAPIPQLSAHDVAWITNALLRTPEGANPNDGMPDEVKATLYGGFSPQELRQRLLAAITIDSDGGAGIDNGSILPDHILTPGTTYGALPSPMKGGVYKRISMAPRGQEF
ncbi:MAG: hypothetical protein HYS17_07940 [Micavibrio aeruginosavorus]|uniref:Uncharacterized protein n=1 Tax=Micavibrio aeruginosavorus TaxID=349221 RepID=A0A7T5UGZ3_9BACT|nr:MAG: hypothetical protein HYS17_07940 [Micavibrio aeruginosavorus]